MPIKLPKGFTRRKSSGNALDDVETAPQPSFRVFERPNAAGRSLDGVNTLRFMSEGNNNNNHNIGRRSSLEDPDPDNIFAGINRASTENLYVSNNNNNNNHNRVPQGDRIGKLSGSNGSRGTNNSGSTGGYDGSSTKFSSSSTLPSSTDNDTSAPPVPTESRLPFSLRAAGRTFSFGAKAPKPVTPSATFPQPSHSTQPQPVPPPPPPHHYSHPGGLAGRERAMTTSTASTATPPRLPDSDMNFGQSSGFENIFDDLDDKPKPPAKNSPPPFLSGVRESLTPSPTPPDVPSKETPNKLKSTFLSALRIDNSKDAQDVEPSPHSLESKTSRDNLMRNSFDEGDDRIETVPHVRFQNPYQPNNRRLSRPLLGDDTSPLGVNRNAKNQNHNRTGSTTEDKKDPDKSSLFDNEEDVVRVPAATRNQNHYPANKRKSIPRRHNEGDSLFAQADLAARYEDLAANPDKQAPKVMTPAQFESYRRQQELAKRQSSAASAESSDEDSDDYDDDDEAEKNRQAASQRRKQEAHLSVYRQQMMKVTGEQASLPNLETRRLSLDVASTVGGGNRLSPLEPSKAEGEDDEDVPLGILAAHGFPSKNRPPSRLAQSASNPNLRASMYPYIPGNSSVAGDSTPTAAANRGSLPVFARNLPKDPYFGAGLVNPSNRESLAMGGGSSVYGGPTAGSPSGLPPGGLVGVIASEERAKAMRRGSPNARGPYDPAGGMPGLNGPNDMFSAQGMMNPGMGMSNVPGQPPMFSPNDHAQLQMSQQMTQMMQTQIQWMQYMMQMQGMQGGQPMPPMPPMPMPNMPMGGSTNPSNGLLTPPGPNQRPMSMMSSGSYTNLPGSRQVDQRTLSMLDPSSAARFNHQRQPSFTPDGGPGPGYAPSVAPSERSNIGTASRYRPVSTINPDLMNNAGRSSTFTAGSLRPWNDENRKMSLSSQGPKSSSNATSAIPTPSSIRPVSTLRSSTPQPNNANDDEDDDEGWAEMAKAREKKKSNWKFKKEASGFGNLFHHTAI